MFLGVNYLEILKYMAFSSMYLISGATSAITSASVAVATAKSFSFMGSAGNSIAGTNQPPTGTYNINLSLDFGTTYTTIFSTGITSSSSFITQWDGPCSNVQVSINPFTTGVWTGILMYVTK
jgi:hypothetical protein